MTRTEQTGEAPLSDEKIEPLLSLNDAFAIGTQIADMADRVTRMNSLSPGTAATWGLEIDGRRYVVTVKADEGE